MDLHCSSFSELVSDMDGTVTKPFTNGTADMGVSNGTTVPVGAAVLHSFTIADFLSTCSKSELDWLVEETSTYLASRLIHDASSPAVSAFDLSHSPLNIPVDVGRRKISFPITSADATAVDVAASFLSGLLMLSAPDGSSKSAKPSRLRTKITAVVARQRIHEGLSSTLLQQRGNESLPLLWAVRNAQCEFLKKQFGSASLQTGDVQEQLHNPPPNFLPSDTSLDANGVAPLPPSVVVTREAKAAKPDSDGSTKSTLVIPSAGRSSRFPGHKPKWLLTQPSGRLMLVDAIAALNLRNVQRIVVGVLKEHIDKHCGSDTSSILRAFEDSPVSLCSIPITIVVISTETVDQVQTIECILHAANVTGPIFLKDCDNQFACDVPGVDGVATLEITKEMQSLSIPAGKSYATLSATGNIDNIVEKVILGSTFCVGGYAFASAANLLSLVATARSYDRLTGGAGGAELAVSDVIWLKTISSALSSSLPPFVAIPVTSYEDWGTLAVWQSYVRTFKTLFLDIDGTIIKNSGGYFAPIWGTQPPLLRNVTYLQALYARGRTQIILTTSRPDSFRAVTEEQLKEAGVPYDTIIFGMFHAQRVLVNDFAKTNPFPSAVAVNLKRDADDMTEMMGFLSY